MEETRPETENRMEIENRIRNLVWTVSGDYTLEIRPDVERFGREKYCALYDGIRQGAFAKWFDRETYQLYLVKKIYCHAMEAPLKMIARAGDRGGGERTASGGTEGCGRYPEARL